MERWLWNKVFWALLVGGVGAVVGVLLYLAYAIEAYMKVLGLT